MKLKRPDDGQPANEHVELEVAFTGVKDYPPIHSDVKTDNFGVFILESDLPRSLGGRGSRPTPLQFFIFGIAAMYVMTLARTLMQNGVGFSKIVTRASCQVDYTTYKGKRKESLKVALAVGVKPQKPDAELRRFLEQARSECPIFRGLNIQILTY